VGKVKKNGSSYKNFDQIVICISKVMPMPLPSISVKKILLFVIRLFKIIFCQQNSPQLQLQLNKSPIYLKISLNCYSKKKTNLSGFFSYSKLFPSTKNLCIQKMKKKE
jgi:hypothetical protein